MAKVFNYITINYEKDIYTPSIDMMQGDTGRGLTFSIASPIDGLDDEISNLTATLNVVKPTGETQTVTGTIESLGNDMAKVTIEPSSNLARAINVSGLANATLVIANATQTVTSFNFKIKIKPNPFYPKPTVRKFDVTKVSRITGVQQYEHCVQSIEFVGLNYTGNMYIVLNNDTFVQDSETEGYHNTVPLTNNTFIIGQPMTFYSGVFSCQLLGETTSNGETTKFEISPIFYIEVAESIEQGEETEYPIDPNITFGIDEYITEVKEQAQSEIEATGDAVIESIPSDYTELEARVDELEDGTVTDKVAYDAIGMDVSAISSNSVYDSETQTVTTVVVDSENGSEKVKKQTIDGEVYEYIRFNGKYFQNSTHVGNNENYDLIIFTNDHVNIIHTTSTLKASYVTMTDGAITGVTYANTSVEKQTIGTWFDPRLMCYEVPVDTFPFQIVTVKKEPLIEPKYYEPLKFELLPFNYVYQINDGILTIRGTDNSSAGKCNVVRLLPNEKFIKRPFSAGKQFAYVKRDGTTSCISNANKENVNAIDLTDVEYIFFYANEISQTMRMVTNFRNGGDYEILPPYKPANYFADKVLTFIGDSVTEGINSGDMSYPSAVETLLHPLKCYNLGHQGTRISGNDSHLGYSAFWTDSRINEIPDDSDFIFIMGGLNDGSTIAESDINFDNHDTNNIIGALNVMLSKIYYRFTQLPNAEYYTDIDYSGVQQIATPKKVQVVLLTQTRWFASPTRMWNNAVQQNRWAEMWSLKCIDVGGMTGYNRFSTTSALHFSSDEYYYMGVLIASELAKFNNIPIFEGIRW